MNSKAIVTLETMLDMHTTHHERNAQLLMVADMIDGSSNLSNAARSMLHHVRLIDMTHSQVKAVMRLAMHMLIKQDLVALKKAVSSDEIPF